MGTTIHRAVRIVVGGLACFSLILIVGCTPPGPRALLQGEQLIREGKYEQAVERLKVATTLLPQNAQAWNHLGLAYHGARQPDKAQQAYQQALALDRNLAVARFNLGCLWLEQNNPSAAITELTTYTLLQPDKAEGWTKLGLAQMQLRQQKAADQSFSTALKLQPQNPEAWNGMGMLSLQRNQPREALNYFTAALQRQTNYGPALLNQAIVHHQHYKNRPLALQKYREYLALKPTPADAGAITVIVQQLQQELQPPVSLPRSNEVAQITGQGVRPPAISNTVTQPAAPKPGPNGTKTSSPVTPELSKTNGSPAQARTTKTEPAPNLAKATPPTPKSSPTPPRDTKPESVVKPGTNTTPRVKAVTPPKTEPTPQIKAEPTPPVTSPSPSVVTVVSPERRTTQKPAQRLPHTTPLPSQPMPARYPYQAPAKPPQGNRRSAEIQYNRAVEDHREGRLTAAIAGYEKAIQADPSLYDAHYNLGLAAYQEGQLPRSLVAYEYALVLNPNSFNARYNFALALQQANYPRDAANELEKLLIEAPADTRLHLFVANLYARRLFQPQLAREHYLKVLELEPTHPEATAIRYWLAASPPR